MATIKAVKFLQLSLNKQLEDDNYQYIDENLNRPIIDSTDKTKHARIRHSDAVYQLGKNVKDS